MQPSRPPPERAQGYVLGPLSAALQLEGTFDPAGPWLATTDEIDDVLALGMGLDVNGVRRQTSNTNTMIFDPYFIVHYLSQFLVLEPSLCKLWLLAVTESVHGAGLPGARPALSNRAADVMIFMVEPGDLMPLMAMSPSAPVWAIARMWPVLQSSATAPAGFSCR